MKKSLKTFIESRRTTDNFWNLIFFLGFAFGFAISIFIEFLTKTPTLAGIVWWITILAVPYIVTRYSGITFDKENMQFLNRDNEVLNDRKPNTILMIICIGMSLVLGGQGGVIFKYSMLKSVCMFFFGLLSVLGPVLYCIYKNFPIAVYFKKENWPEDKDEDFHTSSPYDNMHTHHHKISYLSHTSNAPITSSSNLYTDPSNRWYSGNIYNRK